MQWSHQPRRADEEKGGRAQHWSGAQLHDRLDRGENVADKRCELVPPVHFAQHDPAMRPCQFRHQGPQVGGQVAANLETTRGRVLAYLDQGSVTVGNDVGQATPVEHGIGGQRVRYRLRGLRICLPQWRAFEARRGSALFERVLQFHPAHGGADSSEALRPA